MKEYSGRSNIKIYNVDCMDFLVNYKDDEFDLAIIDVPYGIEITGKIGGDSPFGSKKPQIEGNKIVKCKIYNSFDDSKSPNKDYFNKLIKATHNQIIWGANHFISKIPFDSSCWIVWDKDNSGNFADCELAYTSFDTAVRKFKFRWNGMLQENMKDKELRIHPTQKPVQLYKWLLQNYAKKGDKILDTHGGSMSLAIACWDLKYDLTCFEIDKDYYNDAIKRFENHISQAQIDDNIDIEEAIQKQIF